VSGEWWVVFDLSFRARLPTVDLVAIQKEYEDAAKEAAGKYNV
jgi:hypothetical protein